MEVKVSPAVVVVVLVLVAAILVAMYYVVIAKPPAPVDGSLVAPQAPLDPGKPVAQPGTKAPEGNDAKPQPDKAAPDAKGNTVAPVSATTAGKAKETAAGQAPAGAGESANPLPTK